MSWRVAKSLETLRLQLNTAYPKRSKASDGGIGDARHKSSSSDHNPHITHKGVGIVTARDFTHDPANGLDCQNLADALVKSKDPRIKYIIWKAQICSSKVQPWIWRPYNGKNAHRHHLHLSVDSKPSLFDSEKPWDIRVPNTSAVAKLKSDEPETQPEGSTSSGQIETLPVPQSEAPPIETTQFTETATGAMVETQLNQQNVTETAFVEAPAPQGVFKKLTAGIGTLFGGTMLYTVLERFGAMSFSTQAIIIICFVVFIAFLGFVFWMALDAWKQNNRVKILADVNTDISRKDIEFTEAK